MEEKCWQWRWIWCITDLSKAFDCLPHQLLIAKLDAYGFDKSSLKLIHSYLSNRKQRIKINDRDSSWSEILYGVPQRSISGPLLFNIFICDVFYFLEDFDVANYVDDSTPYCAGKISSIVNEGIWAFLNLFVFFFLQEDTHTSKQKQKKQHYYAHKKTSKRRKVACLHFVLFLLFVLFVRVKSFCIKK